jgi:HEAT repeat protein
MYRVEKETMNESRAASDVLEKLKAGDRRSIGRASEVVADVLRDHALFEGVFGGMLSDDPLVRMRAADVIEKVTAERPEYLQPYKAELIERVARIEQQEVRWHVAQMLPRLDLAGKEIARAIEILRNYLKDESKIVQTMSMQALADLAERDVSYLARVVELLETQTQTGSPAVKSRGHKLLIKLRAQSSQGE